MRRTGGLGSHDHEKSRSQVHMRRRAGGIGNNDDAVAVSFEAGVCVSATEAFDECVDFVWRRGAGLPLPPPVILSSGDPVTGANLERMIVPSFLRERVTRADRVQGELDYEVVNPGILTFYPVSEHAGSIRFAASPTDNATSLMRWEVEAVALPLCAPFVRFFTSFIVNACIVNLQRHCEELQVKRDDLAVEGSRGGGGAFEMIDIEFAIAFGVASTLLWAVLSTGNPKLIAGFVFVLSLSRRWRGRG